MGAHCGLDATERRAQNTLEPGAALGRTEKKRTVIMTDSPLPVQVPAIGTPPGIETLLVASLMWTPRADRAEILALVADDDLASPHLRTVLAALRGMVAGGAHVSPQLLLSRLSRDGAARPVLTAVLDATTSGAATDAARQYAAAVVAAAVRRRTESAGTALLDAAAHAAEADLADLAARAAAPITDAAQRLARLEGGTTA